MTAASDATARSAFRIYRQCDLCNNARMIGSKRLSLRRPAAPEFLARRLTSVDWLKVKPPASRRQLAEICRAELEWAEAEWRCLSGGRDAASDWGGHPAEAWRLPHEHAAARVINCHIHVDLAEWSIVRLLPVLRSQRFAALDRSRSADHRAQWAKLAARTERELLGLISRRRLARRCFIQRASTNFDVERHARALLHCPMR